MLRYISLEEEIDQCYSPEDQQKIRDNLNTYFLDKMARYKETHRTYQSLENLEKGKELLTDIQNSFEALEEMINAQCLDSDLLFEKIQAASSALDKFDAHQKMPALSLPFFRFHSVIAQDLEDVNFAITELYYFWPVFFKNEQEEMFYDNTLDFLNKFSHTLNVYIDLYDSTLLKNMIDEPENQVKKFNSYQLKFNELMTLVGQPLRRIERINSDRAQLSRRSIFAEPAASASLPPTPKASSCLSM